MDRQRKKPGGRPSMSDVFECVRMCLNVFECRSKRKSRTLITRKRSKAVERFEEKNKFEHKSEFEHRRIVASTGER